jgi:type IX secretion system PorP/SprF family membrane protein
MRVVIVSILIFLTSFTASAQDPNFSQFFASPLTLNPASTGKFNGIMRVAGNYRNQWPTIQNAFVTGTVSVDFGILKSRIPETDQFGVGIMGFTDRGGNGILQNNYLSFSTAYHKALDEDGYNQLGAGFQATYVHKRLDRTSFKFEDMLRSDGFTGITQETFSGTNLQVSYFDMAAGMLYNGTTNGDNNIYAGVSMYHITKPAESFHQGQYFVAPRYTIQAGARFPLGDVNAINLSGNFNHEANARNVVFGGAYEMNLSEDPNYPTNLYLGSWYRWKDAVIPYIGLEFGEMHIGASYDVNISGLRPGSNTRGGAEISLIYIRQPRDRDLRKLNCPKF